MKIGIPKEVYEGERRVATTPDVVGQLRKLGFDVVVESGAGAGASYPDSAYEQAGAAVAADARTVWHDADIILKVRGPALQPALGAHEADLLREGQTLISFLWPAQNPELMQRLAARRGNVLAVDSVPRISRAQKMDALSSMANIAGYRAVIEAAQHFGRFFTGQITAAGKIPPAKILIIGAGVAGLSAIGSARSMGAIVRAFDTRPEVKEQVESMDAEFLMLDFKEEGSGVGGYAKVMSPEFIKAEMALFAAQAKDVDIIITTALIPGKPAPKLITTEMVKSMKPGSVIVDLAAEQGGNCELTEPGKVAVRHGVTIIGYMDLPSRLAAQSSQLYATNLRHLLSDMCPEKNGVIKIDFEDEAIRGATVIKAGEITWPPPPPRISAAAAKPAETKPGAAVVHGAAERPGRGMPVVVALGALSLFGLGLVAPPSFMAHFTVFVLACFVGYMVIWNVTPALHTPLMSVTNAISSIIIIGALLQISSTEKWIMWLAGAAILMTSVNIAGGFAVTRRMLQMFRR
ncbi:MAG: Re/Si-specific NAD(P)(+) transhydrogenase subunit alpha [Gammaproteobacteria bacterium]|nr:Re/Si-specific NAD(P)(+) transhydrogenase subunit alpha [Gammaproteobacteria bacterium]